jgi:cytoskeletal protein RodZ
MGLGETIKKARTDKGITLELIEEETKIRRLYLEAIENEDFSVLPPKVYAVGFVKRYARFLGLDEKQLAEEFKQLAYGGYNQEEEIIPVRTGGYNLPVKNIVAGILFLLVVLWVGNYMIGFFSRAIENNDSNNPGIVTEIPPPQEIDEPEIEEPEPVPVKPDKVQVSVKAKSDCWLRAIVDDEKVFEAVLRAGQEQTLEGRQSVNIRVGNAGGVEITYNGEIIEPLGQDWEVKEREFVLNDQSV